MAHAFIGMTILVRLKPPSDHPTIVGKVVNIHDNMLILENVVFPHTGVTAPSWNIPSFLIADLEVTDGSFYQPRVSHPAFVLPAHSPPTYSDPAILSYSKPSPNLSISPGYQSVPAPTVLTPAKELPADIISTEQSTPSRKAPELVSLNVKPSKKALQKANGTQSTVKKGKGWRDTPLLEEALQPASPAPSPQVHLTPRAKGAARGKKPSRRLLEEQQALQNGWATEEVTDVQELGDFDFEANLCKFDKKAVFEEIRAEDMTADEDRLVSHNRLARPGTYGGKNLHPTEMVLSPPMMTVESELDLPSDGPTDAELGSGRISRQSLQSKLLNKLPSDRAFSIAPEERIVPSAIRRVSSQSRPLNVSVLSSNSMNRSTSSLRTPLAQAHFDPPYSHLRIQTTDQHCPTLSSERLGKVVESYSRRNGLTAESLTELTARGIAQAICRSTARLHDPVRRNSKSSVVAGAVPATREAKPVIVILAGNHENGARAVAAVRHLFGRSYKILISCTDFASPDQWHPSYARQLVLLQSTGRRGFARLESWPTINAQIKKLHSPPALIVDALLDGTRYGIAEDVHKAIEVREVIDWCNRSRAPVISVSCPSGYDADTGETTVLEGEPVAVKPDRVVALGGVLQGVFEAMSSGDEWGLSLLDVGLSSLMKGDEMVRFGGEWSLDVVFQNVD